MRCKEEGVDIQNGTKHLNHIGGQILDDQNSPSSIVIVSSLLMQQTCKALHAQAL
jgi:hypothetical protein